MGEAKKFKAYEQRVGRSMASSPSSSYPTRSSRGAADALRERARNGEKLDDLLPEGFALVREASRRSMGSATSTSS